MSNEFMTLEIPNSELEVIVKLDNEGVIIDVYDWSNDDREPVASTWKMYDEFGVEVKEVENE